MADSSVSSVGGVGSVRIEAEAVKPQLIQNEIAELKRKLQDAEERLKAVKNAPSHAVPSQPAVSSNGISSPFPPSTKTLR